MKHPLPRPNFAVSLRRVSSHNAASAAIAATVLAAVGSGCGGGKLPGHYWDVKVSGTANECTGNAADYTNEYRFRAIIDGNDLQLAIKDDIFATGTIEACSVVYSSLAWSDYRDGNEIQWEILGEARVNIGPEGGCVNGSDWEGTETFLVTNSAHPDVSPGCTYTLSVDGTYQFEVE